MILYSLSRIERLWISVGGSRGWAPLMAAVALAESGGQVTVVQQGQPPATTGWGLWQITPGTPKMLTAEANARAALQKFAEAATPLDPWYLDRTWQAWAAAGRPREPSLQEVKGYLASWGWATTTPGLREDDMISTSVTSWTEGAQSHVVVVTRTTTPTGKTVLTSTTEHYFQASGGPWQLDKTFPPVAAA